MRLGWVIAVLLFAAVPAGAQTPTTPPTAYDDPANPGWTCRPAPLPGEVTPPGERGRVECSTRRTLPMAPSRSSSWTPFLAVLAWVFVPMLLAAWVAASRGDSVVIAVVLTFILGWIGFILVWGFLGRRQRHQDALRANT